MSGSRGRIARRWALALALLPAAAHADPLGDARALLAEQHVPELARSLAELARQVAAPEAAPGSRGAFDAERLFEAILAGVAADWDAERAAGFRRFYGTPTGERVLAAEGAALRGEPAEREAFRARQARAPAPEPRRLLVERIDRASGSSRLYAQALAGVQRRLRPAPDAGAQAAADAELARSLEAESQETALFTFRALGNDDLAGYASFLEGPDAQWYFGAVNRAGLAAVDAAAADVAR